LLLDSGFQQPLDRGDEFGSAFDELGSILRACRCGLVVAFPAGILRTSGNGAETLVKLARGDENLAEQRPGAAVGLGKLVSLREGGPGRVEHSVVGGTDDTAG
jgi:hypothetical protein